MILLGDREDPVWYSDEGLNSISFSGDKLFHSTGGNMDRNSWLKQHRQDAEESYSKLWSPTYDVDGGVYGNESHQQFIQKILSLVTQPGTILDAACGTGRYMGMLLEKGHIVIGIDQAQCMLDQARNKFPSVKFSKSQNEKCKPENRGAGVRPHPCFRVRF
jgi:SAM-dependent methyltransferase